MKHPLDLHRSRRIWRDWDAPGNRLRPRRAAWRVRRQELVGMVLAGIVGGAAWSMLPATDPPAPQTVQRIAAPSAVRAFGFCHTGGGTDCVVDGDTFWMGGTKIRIADIDTPETHPARCPREGELGAAATRRLHALLNSGAVSLASIDRDTDRYGRALRVVSVDGRGVGDTLVAEGLARRYAGGRREGWC
jgi:micrococcal nuclease